MKKIYLTIILFSVFSGIVFAQKTKTVANDTEPPVEFANVKIKPELRGETWAFYLSHNLRYPEEALKNKVTGKVYVSFIIEKDGSLSNVEVVQGLGYGLDEEALRVIKKSPKWRPGYMAKKEPVRVLCVMPISFNPSST